MTTNPECIVIDSRRFATVTVGTNERHNDVWVTFDGALNDDGELVVAAPLARKVANAILTQAAHLDAGDPA